MLPELRTTLYPWWVANVKHKCVYTTEYFEQALEGRFFYADGLPTEFFSHDLAAVNLDDTDSSNPDSLISFVSKWGLPFSPYRGTQIFNPADSEETRMAIDTSDSIHELLYILYHPPVDEKKVDELTIKLGRDERKPLTLKLSKSGGGIISLEEARLTINQLQDCVKELQEYLRCRYLNEPYSVYKPALVAVVLGAPIVPQLRIGYEALQDGDELILQTPPIQAKPFLINCGQLTNAICRQIVDTIENPYEWRKCAMTECETMFKHMYPKGKDNQKHMYCCSDHRNKQSVRNYRESIKNRPDHGIERKKKS